MTTGAAIVGTGFMARVHAEALARVGVPVLGFVGSSPERVPAARLGPAYPSLAEMLDDGRVDAVHICSPNHCHYEHAIAALRAGKHVICEKPLAMTSAESAELVALAKANPKLVRSIQCVPMSPMARRSPPSSVSKRQFQSVSNSSQS